MGDIVKRIFIVGCGYLGRRVAVLERKQGALVMALTHSDESAKQLKVLGIESLMGDLDDGASLGNISMEKHIIYYFAPPPPKGKIDSRMKNFLAAIDPEGMPAKIVLISTTAVYGDCGGDWVTEEQLPNPQVDRAFRRLSAEEILHEWADQRSIPVSILRVPGIYGPGKLPEKRLREGTPVLSEAESPYSNRIHIDDLVRACIAAAQTEESGIYNISDGHPTTMTDYFFHVADAMEIPRPLKISLREAKKELGAGMISYLMESKRISNVKMRKELGVEPTYSDLRAGLNASIQKNKKKCN